MEQRLLNPWTWQDQYGFAQGVEVTGAQRVVYCAGQTSSDANGATLHAGDMAGQARQALDNLETVLGQAGLGLGNVVRLNYYTTDVERFLAEAAGVIGERLAASGCRPASTLLGISRLAFPDLLVELEATAVG
ncbi:MAG: RidA family protein [Actinomycetota bacterium]|nr:RidA family protein [Actinomycetota bacterium]